MGTVEGVRGEIKNPPQPPQDPYGCKDNMKVKRDFLAALFSTNTLYI